MLKDPTMNWIKNLEKLGTEPMSYAPLLCAVGVITRTKRNLLDIKGSGRFGEGGSASS